MSTTRPKRRNGADVVFLSLGLGTFFLAYGGVIIGSRYKVISLSAPLATGIFWSVPVYAAIVVLSWLGFLRRAKRVAAFAYMLAVAPAAFFGTLAALVWVNGSMDRGRHVLEKAPVIDAWQGVSGTRNVRRFSAAVGPWRIYERYELQISQDDFVHYLRRGGRTVYLRVRPGRLGWEWIDTVEIPPDRSKAVDAVGPKAT